MGFFFFCNSKLLAHSVRMSAEGSSFPVWKPFVGGRFVETATLRSLHAPFDDRLLGRVFECGHEELEAALRHAEAVQPTIARLPTDKRAAMCKEVARSVLVERERLSWAICHEAGKPISDARAEVERAALCFELASAEVLTTAGEGQVLPMDLAPLGYGRVGILRRFPVGPVAAISPFNFPLNLAVHKIAPAMAAGCAVILKPASQTPSVALLLAELVEKAGWPSSGLQVVPASRAAADVLVTDERCKLLTFTGSASVGWAMKARAGKKKVTLELGGNAAVVLDETIEERDLSAILPKLVYGAFSYAGQKCISIQRIFVVDRSRKGLFRQVCGRLSEAVAAVRTGDPADPQVLVGPMIDETNARRVENWIAEAEQLGARKLVSGPRLGNFVPPTLLCDVPASAKVAKEEVFGPVCNVDCVNDFETAIERVNDSRYGLQAAVFTRDLAHALSAHEKLLVGAVVLNEAPSFRIDHMPYGGIKDSGLGREGIRTTILDMTEPRLLITGTLP